MFILGWINKTITAAGMWMVNGIYHVAAWVFELFLVLASGELLGEEAYEQVIKNFYVVLGIIMLFIIAFSLLKGMVNPDDNKQGTSSIKKIIVNLITSTVIMALLPSIFTFMYDFQESFITNQNTIGKFFGYGNIGQENDDPSSLSNLEKVKTGAFTIVNGVYTAFFNIVPENCSKDSNIFGKTQIMECQETITSEDKFFINGQYNNYSFKDTINYVNSTGSIGVYKAFAGNVDNEEIDFNFLLSLIAGLLLLYVGLSFCFDMAVRLVKLVFYQLIAPIPIFFRIIPEGKLSGTFNTWVKVTLTCYLEVYVRIFVFYFCIFLCTKMLEADFLNVRVYDYGFFLANFAKAFILMGVITFMRQAPKLISEITGLDSGNMKLGIKDKLAAGGAFTAGAIIGGGLTTGVRNLTNAGVNVANKFKKGEDGKLHLKDGVRKRDIVGGVIGGLASTAAGTVSGAARAGKTGINAKSPSDMKNSASTGAKQAIAKRDERARYKASHDNKIIGFKRDEQGNITGVTGSIAGRVTDKVRRIGESIGLGIGDEELGFYEKSLQKSNSCNDTVEGTYKTKQEYKDASSNVKDLVSKVGSLDTELISIDKTSDEISAQIKELDLTKEEDKKLLSRLQDKLEALEARKQEIKINRATWEVEMQSAKMALEQLQIDLSIKKKGSIAVAVSDLSTDQKRNYAGDTELQAAYERAIKEAFGLLKDGKATGITMDDLDENTKNIYNAMINGETIDESWIDRSNIVKVEEAVDNVNNSRRSIKNSKEIELIKKKEKSSSDSKN